jgi:hypothetical protein
MLFGVDSFSQSIEAEFYGIFRKSADLNSKDSLKLSLMQDNTFNLNFSDPHVCSAFTDPVRFCSGTYNIKGDTLILESKYSSNKYYEIKQSRFENFQVDSSLLIIKPSHSIYLKGAEIFVTIDSIYKGKYNVGDTIMIANFTSRIELLSRCLYDMDWIINLEEQSSSKIFRLSLNLIVKNENLSFKKKRFIIRQKELHQIDDFYFIEIIEKKLTQKTIANNK